MAKGGFFVGTLGLAALLTFTAYNASSAPESNLNFIWISDIHFDPTANRALTDKLAETDAAEWARIFGSARETPSKFGQDTNWPLFESALKDIRKTARHAQFTVVTGDVFVHQFRQKFDATATNHDDAAFVRFVNKTFQFIAAQVESLAPGKPVFYTLGNNDSDCGDYEIQPYGPFLRQNSALIEKMLGPAGDKDSEVDWADAGNYDVRNPSVPNLRVISVNSIFFSAKYKNACGSTGNSDPGNDQMQWLASRLADAKQHNEKVWLIFHIAPGIDGYASDHPRAGEPKAVVPMWAPEYTDQFANLMEQYHDTVTLSLAGHEHMDDFRLVDHSLVLLAPALSPLLGQNPAFRVVNFAADGMLTNATTYYLSNLNQFDNKRKPEWKSEYSFAKAWGMTALDYQNFARLDQQIETNPETRARWENFYSVSHQQGKAINGGNFPWLFCAAGNMTASTFNDCVQRVHSQP